MNTFGNGTPRPIPDLYGEEHGTPTTPKSSSAFGVLQPAPNQAYPALSRIYGYGIPSAVVWIAFNNTEPEITTVKPDGSWEWNLPFTLNEGRHTLKLMHYSSGKNTYTEIPFEIKQATEKGRHFTLVQPPHNDTVEDTCPVIYGTALPGEIITANIAGVGEISTPTTQEGRYAMRFGASLPLGSHTVTVKNSSGGQISHTFTVIQPMLVPSQNFTTPIVRTKSTHPPEIAPTEANVYAEIVAYVDAPTQTANTQNAAEHALISAYQQVTCTAEEEGLTAFYSSATPAKVESLSIQPTLPNKVQNEEDES